MNILTIDVEDWYCDTDISAWDSYEDRVVQNTHKVLDILSETNTRATFFVLGYVAEHFPELVKTIKAKNHEVATHTHSHTPITQQTPLEFEKDLSKSISILEKITGDKIFGFRAPQFSITEKTSWAIDILKRNGLRYDSSVFPVKTSLYGVPAAPLFPFPISSGIKVDPGKENFWELPLSVYKIPGINRNLPIAGGFYLRFFPYLFIKHSLEKINKLNQPAICYLHPWELDPDQPRIPGFKWYHYYRLADTEKKFRKLLRDFDFISAREWLDAQQRKG